MLVSFCEAMGLKPYSNNGYSCSSIVLLNKVYTEQNVLDAIRIHKITCRERGYFMKFKDICSQSKKFYLDKSIKA